MPNYSLNTTGAQFKPFSFQEIIAPYEMMRTAEEKLQNDYIQMSDQVGEWQAAVESSPTLSARLQNYQDKVRAASDRLAATGKLDRGAFFELRKQMTAQIAPIKKAVTEYNKAIELDTKMRAADGTYIAKRQVPTLEDFANGDNRYSGGISGNTVLTRAAAAGKELSKEQRAVIDSFTNDGAFVKLSQETGIPVEQLTLQAIKSGNAPKEVLDVYNSLRDSIGYNDYDQTGKDMIDSNIQLGLLSASRERKEAFQRNPHDEWVSSYQKQKDALEEAWRERKFGADLASSGIVETVVGTNPDGTPKYGYSLDFNILTQRSIANQAGKAQNNGVAIQVPQGYNPVSSDNEDLFEKIDALTKDDPLPANSGNVWQSKDGKTILVQLSNGSYKTFDVKDGELTPSAKATEQNIKMETRKITMNPARLGYSNNTIGIGANYQGQTAQTLNVDPEIAAEAQNIIGDIPVNLDDLREATIGTSTVSNGQDIDNKESIKLEKLNTGFGLLSKDEQTQFSNKIKDINTKRKSVDAQLQSLQPFVDRIKDLKTQSRGLYHLTQEEQQALKQYEQLKELQRALKYSRSTIVGEIDTAITRIKRHQQFVKEQKERDTQNKKLSQVLQEGQTSLNLK